MTTAPGAAPLKILWAIKGLGPGGAETLLVSAARVADRRRLQFDACYVVPWKQQLVGDLEAEGVRVHALSRGRTVDRAWPLRLRSLIRDGRYDVVHAHSPLVAAAARLAALSLPPARRPGLVTTEHSVWQQLQPLTRLANAATCSLDDVRLAVSRPVHESMWRPFRRGVEVLLHGIVPSDTAVAPGTRDRMRSDLGLPGDAVVACTVANLRAQKGYEDLLSAARKVTEATDKVYFLSVGQGVQEQELRQRHAELGLGDRFRFLGHRTDVMQILAASDIFVMSSRFEGFPVAVMEAMSTGLPVVATRVGGLPDAVTSGVDGILTPPADPASLADAILRLAEQPEDRRRMAAAATTKAERYDINRTLRTLERHYERAARHRRVRESRG
jgi:glycosyltransferase involved in cell wall biosynthesis